MGPSFYLLDLGLSAIPFWQIHGACWIPSWLSIKLHFCISLRKVLLGERRKNLQCQRPRSILTTFLGDKGKDKCKHESENSTGRKATNWKGPALDHWSDCQGECEVGPSRAKCAALYRVLRIAGCCPLGCDLTTPVHLAMIFTCSGHLVCVVSLFLEPWERASGWDGLDMQHCAMVTSPSSSLTCSPGRERQGLPGKLSIRSVAWRTVGTHKVSDQMESTCLTRMTAV